MKKKTKAKGRSKLRGDKTKTAKFVKDSSRRRGRQKKTAKRKKNLRNNFKKKIEEEKKKLEQKKKFLLEIEKLHKKSDIILTETNYKIIVSLQQKLPFEIVEIILIETDKYNKIKEIFESFKFEKKLKNLKELVENIKIIDETFAIENLELEKLEDYITEFQSNLTNFHRLKEIGDLTTHFEKQKNLLTKIMEQISNCNDQVEGMLDLDVYDPTTEEIFNKIEKFYHDFYEEDYENNY